MILLDSILLSLDTINTITKDVDSMILSLDTITKCNVGAGIPEVIKIIERQNTLEKVSLIFGIFSSIALVLSAVVAYMQWKKSKFLKRIEYLQNIRAKFYEDQEISEVLYKFDYNISWYSKSFHRTKELQMKVDKTLSLIEYVCYLREKNYIDEEQFAIIKYDVDRAIGNHQVQEYLFNLYHWANDGCSSTIPFSNFIQYGKERGYLNDDFEKKDNPKYRHILNILNVDYQINSDKIGYRNNDLFKL